LALLPYLKREQLPAEDQDVVLDPMHIYELMAHNPKTARAMLSLATHLRTGGTLDPKLKEMLILQVGYVTKCAYEYSHHLKVAERIGISEKDINAIADETAGETTHLDERTRIALAAARQITTDLCCTDELDQLLLKHFEPAVMMDLVVTVGFYSFIVRFLETLKIDVEDCYLPLLQKYPLTGAR